MSKTIFDNFFDEIVLNEMRQKFIDMVENKGVDDMPLDDIFQGKTRKILNMENTVIYDNLKKDLRSIHGLFDIDINNQKVKRKVKIKSPTGEGEKDQEISIGKAINMLKIPEEQKKKYLNWYSSYGPTLSIIDKFSEFVIILSRHPIDVIRMSDMGDISSCHSEGSSYFQCAIQEAKTGGAVAYLVPKSQMDMVKNDFNTDEIFEDKTRNIDGLVPVSRLRIRLYYNNRTGEEYGIVDRDTYGQRYSDFYKVVRDYVYNAQKDKFKDLDKIIEDYSDDTIVKLGGTYPMGGYANDYELFNKFFETTAFRNKKLEHDSDDIDAENKLSGNFLEGELERTKNSLEAYPMLDLFYEMMESEDLYYYECYGTVMIDIPDQVDRRFIKTIEGDFSGLERGSFQGFMEGETIDELEMDSFTQGMLRSFLTFVLKTTRLLQDVGLDYSSITEVGVYRDHITITIGDTEEIHEDVDPAERIRDRLLKIYEQSSEIQQAMIVAAEDILQVAVASDSLMSQFQRGQLQFDNFENTGVKIFESREFVVSLPKSVSITKPSAKDFMPYIKKIFNKFLDIEKPDDKAHQLTFKNFAESYNVITESITLFLDGGRTIDCDITLDTTEVSFSGNSENLNYNLYCNVVFTAVNDIDETFLKWIKYFDPIFSGFIKTYVRHEVYKKLSDKDLNAIQKAEKQYLSRIIR